MAVDRDGTLVREPRPVWVRHEDGRWYPGWHRQWRRTDAGWLALVDYHAPGTAEDAGTHWYREVPAADVELRDGEAPVGVARPEREDGPDPA